MRIIQRHQLEEFISVLEQRASAVSGRIERVVRRIIRNVRKEGDIAVRRYTEEFDSIKLKRPSISTREIESSARKVDRRFIRALKQSARRIRVFHEFQREESWYFSEKGFTLGHIIRPIERIGVYVPGGRAAYPSTVLMNVIPAQVAGVKEIALCVPTPDGGLNPWVAAAIKLLNIKEVYRIGGAQAIAAMAYGTETIKRVDKIVGPGNIYVAVAKRMVFGDVGIDMIAGPSEITIVADKTADPAYVAADLLSQAEHDEMASAILITDSDILVEKVKKELKGQIERLARRKIIKKALDKYGAIILIEDINNAPDIVNLIAPEHLEIMTRNPAHLFPRIKNAGAIFLGRWTPETIGDYAAGPNHTLPTGGTARFSSPLGVYDFIKRTSLLNSSREGFQAIAGTVEAIAEVEGLEAHANTVRVRIQK
jgi:histidinol dehydrogenase